MLFYIIIIIFFCASVDSAVQNVACPEVNTTELDLKGLDGRWYLSAAATDLNLQGDCAMVLFSHKNYNTTDVSIRMITNNTVNYYNGSVDVIADPNSNTTGDLMVITYTDQKAETYAFLEVNYEHYAVVFACYNNEDGNSSRYDLWKLSRTLHIKDDSVAKINKVIAAYNLQDTSFLNFNNTDDNCRINSGDFINPSSFIMASAFAFTIFRRLFIVM